MPVWVRVTEHVQAPIQSHRQGKGWITTLSKDVFEVIDANSFELTVSNG